MNPGKPSRLTMFDQPIEKLGIDKCFVVAADIVEHFSRRFTLNYDIATSG